MLNEYKELRHRLYPEYPIDLIDIEIGQTFEMLNYQGIYMRVSAGRHGDDIQTLMKYRAANPLPFNDDGLHVPIVGVAGGNNGQLFWMAKAKPCRLWSGLLQA